jgi:hypothetical protein
MVVETLKTILKKFDCGLIWTLFLINEEPLRLQESLTKKNGNFDLTNKIVELIWRKSIFGFRDCWLPLANSHSFNIETNIEANSASKTLDWNQQRKSTTNTVTNIE